MSSGYLQFYPQDDNLNEGETILVEADGTIVENYGVQTRDWAEAEAQESGVEFMEVEE